MTGDEEERWWLATEKAGRRSNGGLPRSIRGWDLTVGNDDDVAHPPQVKVRKKNLGFQVRGLVGVSA
jgi:hypothetical protein